MPGFKCKCDNIIKTGEIPNPNEWLIMSDVEYDEFSGMVDTEELYMRMKSMLVCKQCGRLWMYWNGYDNDPVPYVIDNRG